MKIQPMHRQSEKTEIEVFTGEKLSDYFMCATCGKISKVQERCHELLMAPKGDQMTTEFKYLQANQRLEQECIEQAKKEIGDE